MLCSSHALSLSCSGTRRVCKVLKCKCPANDSSVPGGDWVDGTQPEPPPLLDVTAHTLRNFKAEEAFQSLSSNSTQYPSKLGKSGTVNAIFRRQSWDPRAAALFHYLVPFSHKAQFLNVVSKWRIWKVDCPVNIPVLITGLRIILCFLGILSVALPIISFITEDWNPRNCPCTPSRLVPLLLPFCPCCTHHLLACFSSFLCSCFLRQHLPMWVLLKLSRGISEGKVRKLNSSHLSCVSRLRCWNKNRNLCDLSATPSMLWLQYAYQ